MPDINQRFRIILEVSRCTLDMLSQNLYDKTVDCGKLYSMQFFASIWQITAKTIDNELISSFFYFNFTSDFRNEKELFNIFS